jgi:hypothetical protein
MSDRALVIEPYLPQATVQQIERLVENGELVTLDGEVLSASDSDNDSLVAWVLAAEKLRRISRMMQTLADGVLLERCREVAGAVDTEYGTAKESVSRGSISGTGSARIRDILEHAAADGLIPWDAVDNVAPMVAHVTPAKAAKYAKDITTKHPALAGELERSLPEPRSTVKVEPRLA